MTEAHVRANRRLWNEDADDYQRRNAPQIRDQAFTGHLAWGTWNIPESELGVLGEVAGRDFLEFGCGGAQWSTALARNGARPVGFDLSERQLDHARRPARLHPHQPDLRHRRAAGRRSRHRPAGPRLLRPAPAGVPGRDGRVQPALRGLDPAVPRLWPRASVEDLIEPRPEPGATSTYRDAEDLAWSRRWPAESLWRLRKP